jgi:hypothetical protein
MVLYPKDPSVAIERQAGLIRLSWRRRPSEGWAAIVLGILLLGAGIAASFSPLKSGEPRPAVDQIGLICFFAAVAVPLMYWGVAALLNRTRLEADASGIRRFSGPVWVGRGIKLPAQGVRQFFAVTTPSTVRTHTYSPFAVYLLDANDHVWALAVNLPSSFAAHQISHELDDFYGIEDMPVYGVTTDPAHPGPRKNAG